MQNQTRKFIIGQLLIQAAITVLYGFALINIFIDAGIRVGFNGILEYAVKHLPFLVILICSILPQISLLIKHKLHSQDGEILPLLFTVVALQGSLILNDAAEAMGYFLDYPFYILVLQRFSLLAAASMFLLSSLRYFGFSSSRIELFNFVFLAVPLLVSAIVPVTSYEGSVTITSSVYEVYLQFAIVLVYLASVSTFLVTAFKDKTALNIKRSISFISLSIGLYYSHYNTLVTSILSPVFYILGTVILIIDAGDSL